MDLMQNTDTGVETGRRRLLIPGILVAALLAAGIGLTITNLTGDDTPAPAASPTQTATATVAGGSVCGLTARETAGTLPVAPATQWALLGTMAAPSVQGQGPGRIADNGFRDCYAQTPTGALLAAANYMAGTNDYSLTEEAVTKLTQPGPGRDITMELAKGTDPTQVPPPERRVQIAGFALVSYTGTTATVDLAFRGTATGGLASQPLDLVWLDGDWKVRLADRGGLIAPPQGIPNLTGYIPWSGT